MKLFTFSASLARSSGGKTYTRMMLGWKKSKSKGEGVGIFAQEILENPENKGFAISEMLCLEIPK